ncbi:MAG: SHOCT domain-containing protein [Ruminococcaceae bacterium]|nr:SHOCT domain-containing protein [Oscillospiraceae bacterium]
MLGKKQLSKCKIAVLVLCVIIIFVDLLAIIQLLDIYKKYVSSSMITAMSTPMIFAIIIAMYILVLNASKLANTMLTIIFAIVSFLSFFNEFNINLLSSTTPVLFYGDMTLFCNMFAGSLYLLGAVETTKKPFKKTFAIISTSFGIAINLISAIIAESLDSDNSYILYCAIAFIFTNIALILLVLDQNIIQQNSSANNSGQTAAPSMDPLFTEQELVKLKELYELGIINEEEYKNKKADIINNL